MVINRIECEQSNNGKAGKAVSGLISIFIKGSLYLICITEKGLLGAGISQAQRPFLELPQEALSAERLLDCSPHSAMAGDPSRPAGRGAGTLRAGA